MGWRQQAVEAAERRVESLEAQLATLWSQVVIDHESLARIQQLEAQLARVVDQNIGLAYDVANGDQEAEVARLRKNLECEEIDGDRWMERAKAAETEVAEIRRILAATDLGSLPHDYPTHAMAADRMRSIKDLTLEGLGIIGRAEQAETEVGLLRAVIGRLEGEYQDQKAEASIERHNLAISEHQLTDARAEIERLQAVLEGLQAPAHEAIRDARADLEEGWPVEVFNRAVAIWQPVLDAKAETTRLQAECAAFLTTNRGLIDQTHDLEAEIVRLQAALGEQEAVTALTRVLVEYHNAGEERLAEALEQIIAVGGRNGYATPIAEAALATEPLDEEAP